MRDRAALLASDMDGTVIPLETGPGWEADVAGFRRAVEESSELRLAYVTGRDFALALRGIEEHRLPRPEFLVCDVGTSLFRAQAQRYRLDEGYAGRMREALGGLEAGEIRERLAFLPGLRLQPEDRQTPFKVSYYLPPEVHHPSVLASVVGSLEAFQGRVQFVYSVRARDGVGLVDILPGGVAKDFALRYLLEVTGADPERLVYAGDSGNDTAAMLAGFRVVVVENAGEGLKEELRARAREAGIMDRLYFSRRPYAGGVLEGCRHFGIL